MQFALAAAKAISPRGLALEVPASQRGLQADGSNCGGERCGRNSPEANRHGRKGVGAGGGGGSGGGANVVVKSFGGTSVRIVAP